jgi:hypothetical protein
MLTLLGEIISVIVAMCVLTWLFKTIVPVILIVGTGILGGLLILKICG